MEFAAADADAAVDGESKLNDSLFLLFLRLLRLSHIIGVSANNNKRKIKLQ